MALIRPTSFWRQVHPRGAIADFVTVWRQAGNNRWRIAAVSALCTIGVFSVMWQEGEHGPPRAPKITYIRTWAPHRTDEEIIASNIANQKRKERLAAEQAASDERVREMYKTLGRMSGMDVDAIEKKAMAERAAEEQAAKERVEAAGLPEGVTTVPQ
jgi:hypothetical protein